VKDYAAGSNVVQETAQWAPDVPKIAGHCCGME
jgi:hypothetical protein